MLIKDIMSKPEIVMVFKTPKGKEETQEILDALHRYSFQILDWHLFETGPLSQTSAR